MKHFWEGCVDHKMFHRPLYLDVHGVGGMVAFTNCIEQVTDSVVRVRACQEVCPFCTKAPAKAILRDLELHAAILEVHNLF